MSQCEEAVNISVSTHGSQGTQMKPQEKNHIYTNWFSGCLFRSFCTAHKVYMGNTRFEYIHR